MNAKPKMLVRGLPTFYGVYETYKSEIMTYGGRDWNSGTTEQYDGYVEKYIVPYLRDHDNKHIGMFTKSDFDVVITKLVNAGKNGPGKVFAPWDPNGVPKKVEYLIRATMHTAAEHMLCEDAFGERLVIRKGGGGGGGRTGDQQARTKKSFTVRQELLVYEYLLRSVFRNGPNAGLLLMYAIGLRNNEAAGANFGYIQEFMEHPGHYYLTVPQTTNYGTNTVKLVGKTKNSVRKVPLPKQIVNLLFNLRAFRMQEAAHRGYTGQVKDFPIACKNNKPWVRCSADDLTMSAKEMFLSIGMRHEDIVRLNHELIEDVQAAKDEMEEDEFREIESDPTAYLLRRNFATHIAALGLRDVEIWYVIGHKIEDEYVTRRAFGDEKLLFAIKRKMDERPVLNQIVMEQNLILDPGESISLNGSKKIILDIAMDQVQKLKIDVTAKEPGDEITLRILPKLGNGTVSAECYAYSVDESSGVNRTIDGTRVYHEKFRKANKTAK